jgi:hypothetical protein
MQIILGDITIKMTSNGRDEDYNTLNCIFSKGFKKGNGSKEVKNFYFYHQRGKGLIFKAGMDWSPQEMKEYMEFLKLEYQELQKINDDISTVDFLSYLISKRRTEIINDITKL